VVKHALLTGRECGARDIGWGNGARSPQNVHPDIMAVKFSAAARLESNRWALRQGDRREHTEHLRIVPGGSLRLPVNAPRLQS
jgi:hypothetical protein